MVTLTLLGREARQKNSALKRQLQEMTLQHTQKTLSLLKELNVSAASLERVVQARADVPQLRLACGCVLCAWCIHALLRSPRPPRT